MEDGQMYISTEAIVLLTTLLLPKLARQVGHQFCILSTASASASQCTVNNSVGKILKNWLRGLGCSLNLPTLWPWSFQHPLQVHYFMVAGKASKARPVEPFYIITYQMTCELLAPSLVTAWGNLCNQNGYSCNIILITSSCLLTIVLLSQFCNTAGGRDRTVVW